MRGKALDKKDRLAFEYIRDRARDRSSSPEVGGIREWFEIDRLVQIIEKMQQAPVYVVMVYRMYQGGESMGAFLDREEAISVAREIEEGDSVVVEVWNGLECTGTAYYKEVD